MTENLILNLVLFWSGCYKGMDKGQPYVLNPDIWQVIGATSAEATKTIGSFKVPINDTIICSIIVTIKSFFAQNVD